SLRYTGVLGQSNRGKIESQCQRLAVEVAPADDISILKYERIVGHSVYFGFQHGRSIGKGIAAGAVDLRHASQTVRVLHLSTVPVRFQDFASLKQLPHIGRNQATPRM